ncbi:MAG: mechanosensitive ion channel, partial [Verrucomicrobiales bacterium]|nr:mechanosensitive ion channel [Verrucomicrobiales bacterium]
LFGCWLVWSEVIPVLKYLDARTVVGNISISDLIWLAVISLITTIVFQNLPGLLEVTFLRALELESGVRNAIITICQYTIIAIGAAVAFTTIGLDMANFGWIAAALSVGLGFGLQEVVANFVSGLILLFERPIRVGDIVTVAGVDGVVTKIRIRATTITNWDKKEFIVPNKEFVTGTIMNWTLSNPMTRLVFPVGVAYGSDIRKTQEILLDIARSQPDVLTDPEPAAVFELFGDSSLNFTLRLYLPRPELRLEMTHRINTLIHDRFLNAGIAIPFPQRDLHVRSIDPSIPLGPKTMPGE